MKPITSWDTVSDADLVDNSHTVALVTERQALTDHLEDIAGDLGSVLIDLRTDINDISTRETLEAAIGRIMLIRRGLLVAEEEQGIGHEPVSVLVVSPLLFK